MKSEVHLIDCMEFMRSCKDKQFDLACVDPPYGIGESMNDNASRGKLRGGLNNSAWGYSKEYTQKKWDKEPPSHKYFEELFRVSKNQIVFGANHFMSRLYISAPMMKNIDSSCWIVWDKENGENDFADCELAWTSFNTAVRRFKFKWQGMLQGDMKNKEIRIHPTQKPVALYDWIFKTYAKPNDTILDTHMGSQSSRISAYKAGLDYTGCELDPEYFEQGNERFRQFLLKYGTPDPDKAIHGQQINLF
jgi:site-specific DNA-methyltransferase (adenine-specific)